MRVFAFILALISGIFITAVVFLWFAAGEIYDYEDSFDLVNDAPQTDVVLVLAGGKKRIPNAADLWTKIEITRKPTEKEPVLFLSGVGHKADAETLIEQGVPKDVIARFNKKNVVFETVSENTFENAQYFASFVRERQWKNIVLVTAGYHMRRAQFILEKLLGPEITVWTHTVDAHHFDRNEWRQDEYSIRVTLMEYVKWLYYRYHY